MKKLKNLLWFVAIICLIGTYLTSCGTTQNISHKCELMQNGQKCLPDHSCCK